MSPAKFLTGIRVVNSNGKDLCTKTILRRELVFKTLVGIILPAYLLQRIFPIWSPLITLSIEFIILCLSLIFLIIFRKSWWELFSKTITIKSSVGLKAKKGFILLLITSIFTVALAIIITPAYRNKKALISTYYPEYPVTHETETYTRLIKNSSQNPVDYVFNLFQKYDIVVLSERYHPEYTQYELIYELISDKRFIDNVGNLFTEIGSVSFQDTLNGYLHTSFNSEEELDKNTAALQRNSNAIWPIWDATNHFDLLKKINLLNNQLPDSSKINWYYADIPVNWEKTTKENYLKGFTAFKRDSLMAMNILDKYKNVIAHQKKRKALVVLNTNHGYALLNQKSTTGIKWLDCSTTSYLMKEIPDKVANVMLNTASYIWTPIQYGKWDTAFRMAGNQNAGFNFENSPFGTDKWDSFFLNSGSLKYKDIFTGFIFYKPLDQQIKRTGFPFELENFQDTLMRRAACVDTKQVEIAKRLVRQYDNDPLSLMQVEAAPYALFLNGLTILVIPLFIIISYVLSVGFFVKNRQ